MMFTHLFALAALAAPALAQWAYISAPNQYDAFAPGDNLTVQVTKPDSIDTNMDIAIVLGLAPCQVTGGCTQGSLGSLLYTGPFTPAYLTPGQQPYQSFNVQIPTGFPAGQAALSLTDFVLLGAGPYPQLELSNITIYVE